MIQTHFPRRILDLFDDLLAKNQATLVNGRVVGDFGFFGWSSALLFLLGLFRRLLDRLLRPRRNIHGGVNRPGHRARASFDSEMQRKHGAAD